MIPHRTLGSEICGNGLKGRVTACRKRLRFNRVAQRAQVNDAAGEVFKETTPVSRFQEYAAGGPRECETLPAAVVCNNGRSPFAAAEPGEGESLLLVGEQEVAIT